MVKIVDGEGAVLGRLASFVAKKALEGNELNVLNCDKIIITGNKKDILGKRKSLIIKGGHSQKGPRINRISHQMVKRTIRGMLPDHRMGIGRDAFKRIKCYDGVPVEFKDKKMISVGGKEKQKYMNIEEMVRKLK